MDYEELQKKILIATNKLNAVVSVDHYDYTNLPRVDEVVYSINEIRCALNNIQDAIINQDQF